MTHRLWQEERISSCSFRAKHPSIVICLLPRGEAHIPLVWKCCCFSGHCLWRKNVYFCEKCWKAYASLGHAESNKVYQQALLRPFQTEQNLATLPHSHLFGAHIPIRSFSSPNTQNCSGPSSWWAWHWYSRCHFDISCKQHLPDGLFLEELQCSPKLLGSDRSGFFCFSWSARSTKAFHHLQQRSAFIVKRVESLFLFSFERLHQFWLILVGSSVNDTGPY